MLETSLLLAAFPLAASDARAAAVGYPTAAGETIVPAGVLTARKLDASGKAALDAALHLLEVPLSWQGSVSSYISADHCQQVQEWGVTRISKDAMVVLLTSHLEDNEDAMDLLRWELTRRALHAVE